MSTELKPVVDPFLYVGNRIKEMKDLTKQEKRDVEFLERLEAEHEKFRNIPNSNYDADKVHKIRTLYINEKARRGEADDISVEMKYQMASKLLPNLKKHYDAQKTATREVFLVVDEQNHLGALIKQSRSVKETIRHYLGMNIVEQKLPMMMPKELGELADIWFDYEQPVDFETFGGFSADKWCLGRCLYRPSEKSGPFPTWQKFLSRMNDPAGFASWIYGVASKRYRGRQILWLYGPHGEDGKTFIQKLIASNLFPNVSAAMTNAALASESSRFLGSEFEGKTLAYWDDCNNQNALFLEVVKQLSAGESGNVARIEGKGAAVYQGQLETRLWINSNFAPNVTQDNFVTSRLLFITLDKMDEAVNPNIGEQFKEELPFFLNWAKKMYETYCKDDYKIVQPDEVVQVISDFGTEFEQKNIDIFNDWFEPTEDPNQYVTAKRVSEILKNEGLHDQKLIKGFYDWMTKRHSGSRRNVKRDGKTVSLVIGIREKQEGVLGFVTRNPGKGGFKH